MAVVFPFVFFLLLKSRLFTHQLYENLLAEIEMK